MLYIKKKKKKKKQGTKRLKISRLMLKVEKQKDRW